MYFATIKVCIPYSFYEYTYDRFFNSKSALEYFRANFETTASRKIIKTGSAYFNDRGILCKK